MKIEDSKSFSSFNYQISTTFFRHSILAASILPFKFSRSMKVLMICSQLWSSKIFNFKLGPVLLCYNVGTKNWNSKPMWTLTYSIKHVNLRSLLSLTHFIESWQLLDRSWISSLSLSLVAEDHGFMGYNPHGLWVISPPLGIWFLSSHICHG